MTRGEEKSKRRLWRPRYSLRTVAILVTLVCAYLAAWEATIRLGIPKVSWEFDIDESELYSPAPFIVHSRQTASTSLNPGWLEGKLHQTFFCFCLAEIYWLPFEWVEWENGSREYYGYDYVYPDDVPEEF